MSVRSSRVVGFVATGALVAGLAVVPMTTTASASSDDPVFYPVDAEAVAPSSGAERAGRQVATREVAAKAKAKVKKSKGEQILQIIRGIQGVGNDGLAVAAGPKQVIQLGGLVARAYNKNNGTQAANKSTNQFFGLNNAFVISQPTVVYDPIGKRFIAAAVTENGGDIALAMRISKGTAAAPFTKKKWRPAVEFAEGDAFDEAQPQVGVSSDKIVVTATTTDVADPNRIFFFPKSAYFKGNTPGAWAADLNNTYDGQSPAVNASKQPNIFVAIPDTLDVTVTTYTGAATTKKPKFSKNVVYPTKGNLTVPPPVVQGGGDSLDLGPLAFSGVAWRKNKLYAAATGNCTGFACIRVFGINTGAGVSLKSDEKISNNGVDLFSPDLAIDGAGYVHLALTDVGTKAGPSQAVLVRKGANKWTKARFVRKGNAVFNGPGGSSDWWMSNSAALDPTSPWDVWVTGVSGDSGVPLNGLTTRIARVSLAKNAATLKTSSNRVNKGRKVTFTVKLARPGGDTFRGLPVALQRKPASGGQWKTVKSGKTSANGTARWKVKIKKAGLYRTLGKSVSQKKGQGLVFDKVTSKSQRIRLR